MDTNTFGWTSPPPPSAGLTYKGAWNAFTNNPFLQSGVGVGGEYYIVSVAGTTDLDGVTDWQVGDWAIFEGATNMWQKIDNHDIQSYTTIQEEGSNLTQQSVLDFQGAGVTATNGAGKTIVTIPIQPAYATIQEEGSSLPQRSTIDFQGIGVQATDVGGKTVVTVLSGLPATAYGLYSQTANSTPVTGTVVESTIIGAGVGTLSVPPNGFFVGASFRADIGGTIQTANNQTIRVRVKSNAGVILTDSGVQSLDNLSSSIWSMSINFTIRKIGVAGVADIVSIGRFDYSKTVNGTVEGFAFNTPNTTTFDTTISNTLNLTVEWGSANVGNSIYSESFVLNKIY